MILNKKLIFALLFAFIFISTTPLKAQLNVVTGVTPLQLAQALVGPGATVLNPVLTGANVAYGTFSNGNSTNLGIDHGIILTSGNAVLPNSNTSTSFTGANGLPGDPLLSFAGTTYDACRFEFDVVAYDSILTFNYVFGSDEYTEFVNAGVNDAFGFFISGPGITGQVNIALIPFTATPITIDDVNCASAASAYYVCNEPSGGALCAAANCASVTTTEYDGFTTLLTAQANVMPCDTYHLVLVIADVGDGVYDSGVLIANLLVGTVVFQTVSYQIPNAPSNAIVEGCTTGEIEVKKTTNSGPCAVIDTTGGCQIDTLCYHIVTSGNAIEGIDYIDLPDTVCISALDSVFYLNIVPIADGIFEPPYDTIIVDLYPVLDSLDTVGCSGASAFITLQAMFLLMDPVLQAMPDDTICQTQSIPLTANSNLPNMIWTPVSSLSCSSCVSPIATPPVTTQYIVQASLSSCILHDTVVITVSSVPIVNAGPDKFICPGESVMLQASNAGTYLWLAPGNATLSSSNIPNPIASPLVTTTYVVEGSDNLCGTTTDNVVVFIYDLPDANAWPDSSVCPNESVQLFSSGGVSYTWVGYFLSDDSLQNPLSTPTSSTSIFTVTVTDVNGCVDTAQVTLHIFDEPIANAGNNVEIFLFDSTQLNAGGGVQYSWSPSAGLDNPGIAYPWASPTITTTYVVTIVTADGCFDTDTMIVTVKDEPIVKIPNAFTPNGDGHNDYLKVIRLGVFEIDYLRIYNRWGELVFESHSISDWWDGKHNGEPCEVGVYTYIMQGVGYNNVFLERKGNITLLR